MLTIEIKNDQLKRLEDAVRKSGRKLPQETAAAVNATAKKLRTEMSRNVRTELAASAKSVNETLRQLGRAVKSNPSTTVRLAKTSRIPLRGFGAKQNKSGTSYRISKKSGRKTLQGAFQGPRPGAMKASWRGHVFKRVGKSRLPIVKLFGPSPWGVFVKQGMTPSALEFTRLELQKQLERRIKFNVLKASGAI